jgi:hypothetical protein
VAGLQEAAGGVASLSLFRQRAASARYGMEQFGLDQFTPAERGEFGHGQPRTAESLVATIATHSKLLVMPADERDQVLARVRGYLAARPETSDGEFTLPMVTAAVRSVRR